MSKITLYDYDEIQKLIDDAAESNGGEISESDMALMVQAQTGAIEKLGNLVGYIKSLEYKADNFKAEAKKLTDKAKYAENRVESIKKFILPYLREKGGKVTAGVHTLSIRKSAGVVLADGFDNPMYCERKVVLTPDRKRIKESIESGIEVKGAVLEQRESVQVK